jgi:predicted outer membrane repeat protein
MEEQFTYTLRIIIIIIRLSGNVLSIVKSRFINNTARMENGGAIMLYELRKEIDHINPSVITKCQFINNTARNASGGAIYKGGNNSELVICRNSYVGNSANAFGGAIYVGGENNSIQVTSTTFRNNAAVTEGGGAIYFNGQYANVILTSSTFHNNSASYCGVLDVDNYNHFSVNLTNSIFTYNTASGQTIGGGVACIVDATINVINSTFKHNFANFHAGVFYIDESHTTVDGSLFINNSAALDGGVFYTYIHASDYIIRRSQFSENMAGDDGGVMLIGRLDCYVSIDETIFDFNLAGDRGGVISMTASSLYMDINRINIFNNTAQFGGVISACNSQVTPMGDSLVLTVDPLMPFCKLYDGNVQHANIMSPPETIITTEQCTISVDNKNHAAGEETNKKVVIIISLSVTSVVVFLIAVVMIVLILCVICKKKSLITKTKGFINPSRTSCKLSEDDDIDAL